ncbi:unnamed protein product [Gongylonema pulchrum]|uniref:Col_cuticle_N domain-containing protein n=1 Tax=Gongylonema pulchrum TaxID=637853 RepID=A0A183ESC5_9BILA|nr:unnamed protein product [Gongylonema pulchrum]
MLAISVLLTVTGMAGLIFADLFTSLAEMEHLLEAEKGMPTLLDVYIDRYQQRLDAIKKYANLTAFLM